VFIATVSYCATLFAAEPRPEHPSPDAPHTDVEIELNSRYNLDRRPTAAQPAMQITNRNWKVLVGAAVDGDFAKPYHFTTTTPPANWTADLFDDREWKFSPAPFGNALPGIRTSWKTSDIWLRQSFQFTDAAIKTVALVIFYDEDTEVFVNGQLIWKGSGYATRYETREVTAALRKVLIKGNNTLAIHTHQTVGGQFIDLALLCESETVKVSTKHSD
jgi:hypothetical protein